MEVAKTLTTVDGARIAYRMARSGDPGRTLLLLHGLGSNLTRWSGFVATTGLTARWNLLRPDLRGHGDSLDRGRVGMDVWCRDLAALLDAEGVERAELVGHCMGANLALWFAYRRPERVSGLLLIEPMLRRALTGTLARVATLRPLLTALVLPLRLLAAIGVHRRRLAPLDLANLDHDARAAMKTVGAEFPVARYASPMEDLRSLPTVIYLQDLAAVTGPLPELASIRLPTLTLLSSGGGFGDPERTARLLAALPNGHIERIAAKHWIPTEQPEVMREMIERWCNRPDPDRR